MLAAADVGRIPVLTLMPHKSSCNSWKLACLALPLPIHTNSDPACYSSSLSENCAKFCQVMDHLPGRLQQLQLKLGKPSLKRHRQSQLTLANIGFDPTCMCFSLQESVWSIHHLSTNTLQHTFAFT